VTGTVAPDASPGVTPEADEPRWLDAEQLHAWRAFMRCYAQVLQFLNDDMQVTSEMPLTWYDVMVHLSEAPEGTLCMTDLAERVFISRSGLTRLVDRIEKDGLVHREPAPDDRRRIMASLTEKGFQRLADAAPAHVAALRSVLIDRLTESDVRNLGELMDKVIGPELVEEIPDSQIA
jgi:DNA-binding MarR family transcriptional regulator